MSENDHNRSGTGVAIIGMVGRFPGAPDLDTYWRNLRDGAETITRFERPGAPSGGILPAWFDDPSYVPSRGTLDGVDLFDASFFGYSPREATIMDPQQRLFLECAWEALESAGYDPKSYKGLIGVYGGCTASSYMPLVYADPHALAQSDGLAIAIGNEIAFLTTRVSYKLDLRGPSCPVQTACSTSLVALHLACQGLLNAECDMAIAGGVSVRLPQEAGYTYQPSGILSPDGHCRPFDARSQGTLFSNGIGVVVLKRLEDALADGDSIHAVILGSAVNNDGSQKASFTAPAVGGQGEVIADALMHADVDPESISYLEAHGTATALGDSIEMQALNRVFPADERRQYCVLGSVKSNLGHLDAAAGAAGLIKTVLAMQHREIPPTLHYEQPNPDIDFENSAFRVSARLMEWTTDGGAPRRAGVSSFGFGGTNAHVVLEEAPLREPSGPSRPYQLLTLSADAEEGLDRATAGLARHFRRHPDESLADAAYTLKVGRRAFRHRRIAVCADAAGAAAVLEARDPAAVFSGVADAGDRPVVFMFPGQGAQHPNMARELYDLEPVFRQVVDECCETLREPLGLDLRELLYPAEDSADAAERLQRTRYAQPALFVVEYALAKLWISWGVEPEACIGHSIGEFVAACLAGVMAPDDALRLVALRGALMDAMPHGVMLAVPLAEERVRRLLTPQLWLSVVNSPAMCVVGGDESAIEQLDRRLQTDGVQTQRLHTSHAFHSGLMDGAVAPFVEAVAKVRLAPPSLPYLSNVTGTWIEPSQACDPTYWGRQLRETVRFGDGIRELLESGDRLFLEVGPGQTLSMLVRQQARGRVVQSAFASLRHAKQTGSDLQQALLTLGRLWAGGAKVAWSDFYRDETRRRVPLPTYPFQRQRYWVNPQARSAAAAARDERHIAKTSSIDKWFYVPTWTRTPRIAKWLDSAAVREHHAWIVFSDTLGIGEELTETLRALGHRVIVVQPAARFEHQAPDEYGVRITSPADYRALLDSLHDEDGRINVLHLWSLDVPSGNGAVDDRFSEARTRGFTSLLYLAQAIDRAAAANRSYRIGMVTSGAQDVTGEEPLSPGAATVLGLCRVIPQECLDASCLAIDLCDTGAASSERNVDALLDEMCADGSERMIAYRGGHRWALRYEPVSLAAATTPAPRLRNRGVYLITGGLGDIGLNIAEYLARSVHARLVLTGRTAVPAPDQWDDYMSKAHSSDATAKRLRRLKGIQAAGGEILVARADASSLAEMRDAFTLADSRFGGVHGVIHAAGLVTGDAFRPIAETDDDVCRRQFAPKVDGICVLDQILRQRASQPDLVLLISSLSAVLGGLRFAAYSSANAFLDAFAAWRRRTTKTAWLTINWDSWLRADDVVPDKASGGTDLVMTGAEGIEALRRVLATDLGSQVLVSVASLQARIDQWVKLQAVAGPDAATEQPSVRHPRPNLQTEYAAPADDVERAVASIWEELLGIDQVGVNDSFFELGGDSLLGVQVIARIKKQLAVSVSAVSLYEGPTVALLASMIKANGLPSTLDESRTRGDKRREQKMRRQLQVAGQV